MVENAIRQCHRKIHKKLIAYGRLKTLLNHLLSCTTFFMKHYEIGTTEIQFKVLGGREGEINWACSPSLHLRYIIHS